MWNADNNYYVWSKSRVRRFKRCPREYFLHHYCALNCYVEESGEAGQLYLLKQLTTPEHYMYKLFREMLHTTLYFPKLTGLGRFEELKRNLYMRWSYDVHQPERLFRDVFYGLRPASSVIEEANETLQIYCDIFKHSELNEYLNNTQFTLHRLDFPLSFIIGNVKIYTAPFALLNNNETYSCMGISGARMTDIAAMEQYWGFQTLSARPENFRSFFYNPSTGAVCAENQEQLSFSRTAGVVAQEALQMSNSFEPEVIKNRAFLAVSTVPEHCTNCNFAAICERKIIN